MKRFYLFLLLIVISLSVLQGTRITFQPQIAPGQDFDAVVEEDPIIGIESRQEIVKAESLLDEESEDLQSEVNLHRVKESSIAAIYKPVVERVTQVRINDHLAIKIGGEIYLWEELASSLRGSISEISARLESGPIKDYPTRSNVKKLKATLVDRVGVENLVLFHIKSQGVVKVNQLLKLDQTDLTESMKKVIADVDRNRENNQSHYNTENGEMIQRLHSLIDGLSNQMAEDDSDSVGTLEDRRQSLIKSLDELIQDSLSALIIRHVDVETMVAVEVPEVEMIDGSGEAVHTKPNKSKSSDSFVKTTEELLLDDDANPVRNLKMSNVIDSSGSQVLCGVGVNSESGVYGEIVFGNVEEEEQKLPLDEQPPAVMIPLPFGGMAKEIHPDMVILFNDDRFTWASLQERIQSKYSMLSKLRHGDKEILAIGDEALKLMREYLYGQIRTQDLQKAGDELKLELGDIPLPVQNLLNAVSSNIGGKSDLKLSEIDANLRLFETQQDVLQFRKANILTRINELRGESGGQSYEKDRNKFIKNLQSELDDVEQKLIEIKRISESQDNAEPTTQSVIQNVKETAFEFKEGNNREAEEYFHSDKGIGNVAGLKQKPALGTQEFSGAQSSSSPEAGFGINSESPIFGPVVTRERDKQLARIKQLREAAVLLSSAGEVEQSRELWERTERMVQELEREMHPPRPDSNAMKHLLDEMKELHEQIRDLRNDVREIKELLGQREARH
ncbi:hypothetical protein Pla110_40250 [Polystyrenella longa]|uniref:Uncharacterized protein n=1 Tax=Polystyrenella longa TaxID=2528007 RepID=A0A518CSS5_9PLAN|nr:hypothetical protein [Polystyrenella longa]QDU82270.1 hypothetical protein Pla110_40250 [Polystyrenella longa]